jgi:hypothetical protein
MGTWVDLCKGTYLAPLCELAYVVSGQLKGHWIFYISSFLNIAFIRYRDVDKHPLRIYGIVKAIYEVEDGFQRYISNNTAILDSIDKLSKMRKIAVMQCILLGALSLYPWICAISLVWILLLMWISLAGMVGIHGPATVSGLTQFVASLDEAEAFGKIIFISSIIGLPLMLYNELTRPVAQALVKWLQDPRSTGGPTGNGPQGVGHGGNPPSPGQMAVATDVVVTTPEELEQRGPVRGDALRAVLRENR